jgi:hypothetical protein
MTRTARRRWSREFKGEIDGIGLYETGPVLVHGYDPPVGGKWIDDAIPGKLTAYGRNDGEELWVSPCEVGYGRGFGMGIGQEDDIVVLGPGQGGHRIARMSIASGELIGASEVRAFDQAVVDGDMSITITPDRVSGIMTTPMLEVWTHSREGERYHLVGRSDENVLVVFTEPTKKQQGVLRLDAESGDFVDTFLEPVYAVIHEMVSGPDLMILLVGDRAPNRFRQASGVGKLRLEAYRTKGREATPLWRRDVTDDSPDEIPDVSITMDSSKLYISTGAMLEVLDGVTGRELGNLTIPGLDERIAWGVSQGAGLLAEETRASVFELPA